MSQTSTQNPLTVDVGEEATAQPCTLVIFGGSGDLSHRKLLPALYNLALDGVLPTDFAVLGFAMDDYDDERYRAFAHDGVAKFSRRPIDEQHWLDF
ncbi:MAG: glucose-6-phosphate dehydrogenase, partial [Planctomycetaceae bacterium]|nr:glucose-6-phosphate dehydrogenase [Planctomycetaceae bacterium]